MKKDKHNINKHMFNDRIKDAKYILKQYGYQVDNLWCIDDVKDNYHATDEQAMEVLYDALNNDATMEQIWFAIRHHAEEANLKTKN